MKEENNIYVKIGVYMAKNLKVEKNYGRIKE